MLPRIYSKRLKNWSVGLRGLCLRSRVNRVIETRENMDSIFNRINAFGAVHRLRLHYNIEFKRGYTLICRRFNIS